MRTARHRSHPSIRVNSLAWVVIVSSPSQDSRFPRAWDDNRLSIPGPGRHRDTDRRQRLVSERAELEMGAERDRQAHARFERDDLLPPLLLEPHLATPREKVPDLLDRSMGDGGR